MTTATILPLILSSLASIFGGGLLGVWLTNKRLAPKSKAEARDITAAARDKDWARFQREIARLVRRLEDAEKAATAATHNWHDCEERESKLKARVLQLETWQQSEGEVRQRAAGVVAMDRVNRKERGDNS